MYILRDLVEIKEVRSAEEANVLLKEGWLLIDQAATKNGIVYAFGRIETTLPHNEDVR